MTITRYQVLVYMQTARSQIRLLNTVLLHFYRNLKFWSACTLHTHCMLAFLFWKFTGKLSTDKSKVLRSLFFFIYERNGRLVRGGRKNRWENGYILREGNKCFGERKNCCRKEKCCGKKKEGANMHLYTFPKKCPLSKKKVCIKSALFT